MFASKKFANYWEGRQVVNLTSDPAGKDLAFDVEEIRELINDRGESQPETVL
jgi:hypothetical protein